MLNKDILPTKQQIFELFIQTGEIILIINARNDKVAIPDFVVERNELKSNQDDPRVLVTLSYGLNMPVPIPDLKVTSEGISATLSFNQTPYLTFVPWESVLSMQNPLMQIIWNTTEKLKRSSEMPAVPTKPNKTKPTLKLV